MDANGDQLLDTNQWDAYAAWCAQLVRVVNVDQGRGVRYWEPINELDGRYNGSIVAGVDADDLGQIYNKVAVAMKAVDPAIKVGGGAWANPYDNTGIDQFLTRAKPNLDFFTYHQYASGNGNEPLTNLYNAADGMASRTTQLRQKLDGRGMQNVPMMLDEFNMFWSWDVDQTRQLMRGGKSAVFDALVYKHLIETNDIDAVLGWNDRDGAYGKPSGTDALRPAGALLELASEHLIGQWVQTTSGNEGLVELLAVVGDDSARTLLLINRSDAVQDVSLSFTGWTPATTGGGIRYLLGDAGLSWTSHTGMPGTVNVAPHSLQMFVWTTPVPEPTAAAAAMVCGAVVLLRRVRCVQG